MQIPQSQDAHTCSKKQGCRTGRKHGWLRYVFPVAGLASLVWFLIRVIPKPSRALYPCQRVAFPIASSFVAWLVGLGASAAIFRKARLNLARRRYVAGLAALALSIAAMWMTFGAGSEKLVIAKPQAPNQPIGVAKGIHPGRVVWMYDPQATNWDGPGHGHPWQPEHTNPQRVQAMMSRSIRALAGAKTDAEAWDKLFRYFNKTHGKGDVGYNTGEKIAVKVNFVGFIFSARGVDADTYELDSTIDYMNTSPQLLVALVRQLVNAAGVRPADISIGDSLCYFANEYYDIIHKEFPEVRCMDRAGKFGRVKMVRSSIPIYWSCHPKGVKQDYVPLAFAQASYLINFANLKAHTGAGVTLCAKNHYGSLIRWPAEKGYYNLHQNAFAKKTGIYRPLVDLMGHSQIGGKTMLFLIDGLYSGVHPTDMNKGPRRWTSPPFDGHWTSSLFASEDPVAIDSVGFDFLYAEYKDYPREVGVDDYLHEAALADNPPSGTFYDPDHAGDVKRVASLGVHEHWNNPRDKQYSRNLGTGNGIELVSLTGAAHVSADVIEAGAKLQKLADSFSFTEGPAADAEGNVFFTDQPNNKIYKWSVEGKLSIWDDNPGRANGLYFDKHGNLLACADLNNELWSIDANRKTTVLVKDYKGKKLNGPNDLWVAPNGGVYFTDPLYKRSYWTRDPAMQQDGQHVYYLSPDHGKLIRVTDDLTQPNGIIGTPDGQYLYVADIGAKKTYRYRPNVDGTLSDKTLFCSMGSDGMTIDNEGNVYLTGRGVTVFNSTGERVEHIPVGPGWTANVTFGGKDRHTLFITSQKALYALRMRVTGA